LKYLNVNYLLRKGLFYGKGDWGFLSNKKIERKERRGS
jgi:hypothetical protein